MEYTEDAIDNMILEFSCFEFWWCNYFMVINVVFKFGPVELMVGL